MNITRILLPVDGSEYSDHATNYAIDLARKNNAPIVLLHCRSHVPKGIGVPNVQHLLDEYKHHAEETITPYRDRLVGANVDFKDLIVGGPAGETIADVVKAEECDLVVIGSKGKSDLAGLILGSVTHKVLHLVDCPVLVVK